MPIEVLHQSLDGDEYDNELIEAGDGMLVSDTLDGQGKVIAISCSDDGESGLVRVMPADRALVHSPAGLTVRADVFNAVKPVVIDEGTPPFEQDITGEDNTVKGRFVARYASSVAITNSFLIPEGLIYPDRQVLFDVEPSPGEGTAMVQAVELMLPDEFDQDWCDWFADMHGKKGLRIGIEATYVYWQSPPSSVGPKRMEFLDMAEYDEDDESKEKPLPSLIDGEIMGAKMISFWDKDCWEHIPYAILSDVRTAENAALIMKKSVTELLVPLDQDDGPIIIYFPAV